jgi:hypothetical protein
MDDKKAAAILKGMLDKYRFDGEEKEAVESVIGLLCWTSLAKSGIKTKKAKRDKSTQW